MCESATNHDILDQNDDGLAIPLDTNVYRLTAIKKAAYKFGDRCGVRIDLEDGQKARIFFTFSAGSVDAEGLAHGFLNEVLDQELREVVAEETANIRDVLLAQAFSAANLLDTNGDEGSPNQDPLGIRRSSSEKNDNQTS